MADVHTQITAPKAFRKRLLNTALETAETLKALDKVANLCAQKTPLKERLVKDLKELQKQLTLFKKSIPPLPTEFLEKQAKMQGKSAPVNTVKTETVPAPDVNQGLEGEIAAIKKRLADLHL